MSHTLKKLPKSQVELTITVTPAEYAKDLEKAALRLSERAAIKGFRPGKAPLEMVKQQLGEMAIMQEALERIIEHTFFVAIKEEGIPTIGMPSIKIDKLAPDNDIVFTATVAVMPKITLADLKKISVKRNTVTIGEDRVSEVLKNLQRMQPKETVKAAAATKEDKVLVDMDMFIDRVPVDGGQAKNHQVYLNEPHYIPGLAEQLIGLKKNDTKEFTLKFPKEHYQKHLADRPVDFKIKINEVFELHYPELNDEFAKVLGQESMNKLKELLTANLTREATDKEEQRLEGAILEELIEKSSFDELPEVLVNAEKRKMFNELKHDLERRGVSFEKYLADIKKTEEEIFNDFAIGAEKRAKAALVARQVAAEEQLSASDDEVQKEIESLRVTYANDQETIGALERPEVKDSIASSLVNRKVVEFLKEQVLGSKE